MTDQEITNELTRAINSASTQSTSNDHMPRKNEITTSILKIVLFSITFLSLTTWLLQVLENTVNELFIIAQIPTVGSFMIINPIIITWWFYFSLFMLGFSVTFLNGYQRDYYSKLAIIYIVAPFIYYFIFIYFGRETFSDLLLTQTMDTINLIYVLVLVFFFIEPIFSKKNSSELINSNITLTALGLIVAVVFLLFSSTTSEAQDATQPIIDAGGELENAGNSFFNYWQCEVFQVLNAEECAQIEEEIENTVDVRKNTIEKIEIDIFDTTGLLVSDVSPNLTIEIKYKVPDRVDAKLINYECFVGTESKKLNFDSRYNTLTQDFVSGVNIPQLEIKCPVFDMLRKRDKRNGASKEFHIVVNVEVKDRINQLIPFINCGDEFFEESQIQCSQIGEEYFKGTITDQEVNNFMTRNLKDGVTGSNSMSTTVSGLRKSLPVYLNADEDELGIVSSYDFVLQFEAESKDNTQGEELKIRNIVIDEIQSPGYISVDQDVKELNHQSDVEGDGLYLPIKFEFSANTFTFNQPTIAGSESLIIDYTVNHFREFKRLKTDIRVFNEIKEETSSDTDAAADTTSTADDNGSSDDQSSTSKTQTTENDDSSEDETLGSPTPDEGLTVAP